MRRNAVILAALLWWPAVAVAQEPDRPGDKVSFELESSIIFVKGSVNGTDGLRFIFDTGASVTVLKPAAARKLGVLTKDDPGGRFFGLAPVFKTVGSIGAGKAAVADLPVAIMMVPQADLPLGLQGIAYDGILGYNYISQFITTIDYKAKTLALVPNDYTPEDPLERFGRRAERAARPAPTPAPAVHIGITYATIGDDLANEIGVEGGVIVKAVAPDSPAAEAGMRKGDVIQEIDGRRVERAEDYRKILARAKAGDVLRFSVVRDRKDVDLEVTAAPRAGE
ncbi:MAG: PDZ domain-containing protein [Planctomycetes bacterium]|nr:PDZ domain-containing protein [Planctomycetota bacterium]